MNDVTSAPSETPAVLTSANESTVHSTKVDDALCLDAEERTGVSSGARIDKTSVKSSRLETAEPGPLSTDFVGSYVSENDITYII